MAAPLNHGPPTVGTELAPQTKCQQPPGLPSPTAPTACWQQGWGSHHCPKRTATAAPSATSGMLAHRSSCRGKPITWGQITDAGRGGGVRNIGVGTSLGGLGLLWSGQVQDPGAEGSSKRPEASKGTAVCRAGICLGRESQPAKIPERSSASKAPSAPDPQPPPREGAHRVLPCLCPVRPRAAPRGPEERMEGSPRGALTRAVPSS